ncbi:protein of unknown function [Neorhodopirellula lusitana]|uniref:3-keto-alpha-glucoside-1,2-lyase/3-keto-2-hydroxy-glucal hydratase domain-containing protein n=2 Tax=Neorhodopirellula lusitana TaxID=445327 RepID=A0ABY1QBU9_9BACT|nr:protein of unknown function [Neorhodopirellula lusitana]
MTSFPFAMKITRHRFELRSLLAFAFLIAASGCSSKTQTEPAGVTDDAKSAEVADAEENAPAKTPFVFEAQAYEASAEQLLAARLPIEETTQGWIRLFDGHTLFGWVIAGEANWHVEDETIKASRGKPCLLTTTTQWADFELELEYLADEETNSGVFVRTTLDPKDVKTECYEVNIASDQDAFPTGGVVERKKGEPVIAKPKEWRTMNIVCEGKQLVVKVDDEVICELDDATTPRIGYIGLQFRFGEISFRNIRLRPIGLENLIDTELANWKQYEDMDGEFRVDEEGNLVVDGGKQQLESKEKYGDFTLLADYKMDDPKSNSGLFFRSIPGDVMMGYECQVSNETTDNNPLVPADCGAGGIFRRQNARIVAGEPQRWNSILLTADGSHFAAWVNGLQVSDIYDDREPDENPRKGLRLEPGTLIVQGHDPTTQATYRQLAIQASPALVVEPEPAE